MRFVRFLFTISIAILSFSSVKAVTFQTEALLNIHETNTIKVCDYAGVKLLTFLEEELRIKDTCDLSRKFEWASYEPTRCD